MELANFYKGLVNLGKIGGVPAVALGVIGSVLYVPNLVPDDWKGPVIIGVSAATVLIVWLTRPGTVTVSTEGDNSEARLEDHRKQGDARQSVKTKGKKSPAILIRK